MDAWHIIGNGPGKLTRNKNEKLIRFNIPKHTNTEINLTITNSKLAGLNNGYQLRGQIPFSGFEKELIKYEELLATSVGCKPSLGLLTVSSMIGRSLNVKVSRMNLLPSLNRPVGYSNYHALPAAYHNWLGERRYALSRGFLMAWPALKLPIPRAKKSSNQKFTSLMELQYLPKYKALKLLKALSSISFHSWLHDADIDKLRSAEKIFYLSRFSNHTLNWWMFDNHASAYVAQLHKTLAIVQQVYYQNELR